MPRNRLQKFDYLSDSAPAIKAKSIAFFRPVFTTKLLKISWLSCRANLQVPYHKLILPDDKVSGILLVPNK